MNELWRSTEGSYILVLLDSEGSVATSIGVIDHGVERLVNPLPEEHRRRGPATE